jgi:hypothetical protein
MLDMERLFAHLKYIHDNPPAGTLIKAYFEAQAGTFGNSSSSTSISSSVNNYQYKTFANKQEQQNFEKRQMNGLCAALGVNINQLQRKPKRKVIRLVAND